MDPLSECDGSVFTQVLIPRSRDTIQSAVSARLQQVTPTNNHACLLDACLEALECFA